MTKEEKAKEKLKQSLTDVGRGMALSDLQRAIDGDATADQKSNQIEILRFRAINILAQMVNNLQKQKGMSQMGALMQVKDWIENECDFLIGCDNEEYHSFEDKPKTIKQ